MCSSSLTTDSCIRWKLGLLTAPETLGQFLRQDNILYPRKKRIPEARSNDLEAAANNEYSKPPSCIMIYLPKIRGMTIYIYIQAICLLSHQLKESEVIRIIIPTGFSLLCKTPLLGGTQIAGSGSIYTNFRRSTTGNERNTTSDLSTYVRLAIYLVSISNGRSTYPHTRFQ